MLNLFKNIPSQGIIKAAEIPISLTPGEVFDRFAYGNHSFFLDNGMPESYGLGHFSFIGDRPFLVIRSRGDRVTIIDRSGSRDLQANPFDVLEQAIRHFRVDGDMKGIPFKGGAVGYLSYDLGRFLEKLPKTTLDDNNFPELYLAFYDRVLAFDHRSAVWHMCLTDFGGSNLPNLKDETEQLGENLMRGHVSDAMQHKGELSGVSAPPESNFAREEYLEAVQRALEYIRAGDIYQVNLSQRFKARRIEHPYETYRRLRKLNTAPMAAYLGFDGIAVLSSSPERYLKVTGRAVETRPIKGTRPRGRDPDEDMRHKRQLLASEKDRAELNMIVDLERNDLGRVCEYGSVRVTRHADVESYATVHHLVSTVEGVMRDGLDIVDLLRASFPGGSITGAPKIRSMEIIDELEPTARSVYTGAIGYIGFNRDADLNIAIRTILVGPDTVTFQVGGGIVADSDPEHEYLETLVKGEAIFETLKKR